MRQAHTWKRINSGQYKIDVRTQTFDPIEKIPGAQWLGGRMLDSRPRGRGFEPHRHHYVVVLEQDTFEPLHEISNNVICATSKGSDQPAHTRSLIRTFASCLNIL